MPEAFVYCWTDHSTHKLYVGWHKGAPNDGYVCSSKVMLQEYKKRPQDFTREVLASGSSSDMLNFETKILTAANAAKDPMFYNMHNGNGKFVLKGHTDNARKKISQGKIGVPRPDLAERNRSEMNPARLGLCGRNTSHDKNPMFGKSHSDISKEKISINRKGKGTSPRSFETKQKIAEAKKRYWALKRGELNAN